MKNEGVVGVLCRSVSDGQPLSGDVSGMCRSAWKINRAGTWLTK